MALLLLSRGVGAVPDFISSHIPKPTDDIRIGYLNDAAAPYAGAEFVAAEREQLAEGRRVGARRERGHSRADLLRRALDLGAGQWFCLTHTSTSASPSSNPRRHVASGQW